MSYGRFDALTNLGELALRIRPTFHRVASQETVRREQFEQLPQCYQMGYAGRLQLRRSVRLPTIVPVGHAEHDQRNQQGDQQQRELAG